MKIKMTKNYSDRSDHPRAGDVLDVLEEVYNGSYFDYYRCEWKGQDLDVYPYECEEVR